MKFLSSIIFLVAFFTFTSCATRPVWQEQTGKHFEDAHLVIVSSESAKDFMTAKFNAEVKALGDIANECSFVPHGTFLADQISQQKPNEISVTVKFQIDQNTCYSAKQAFTYKEISHLMSLGYTKQILKDQEDRQLQNKGMSSEQKIERILTSEDLAFIRDDSDLFMLRQQIAFLKQNLLQPHKSKDVQRLLDSEKTKKWLESKSLTVQNYELTNPAFKSSFATWSSVRDRISKQISEHTETRKSRVDRKPAQKKLSSANE